MHIWREGNKSLGVLKKSVIYADYNYDNFVAILNIPLKRPVSSVVW